MNSSTAARPGMTHRLVEEVRKLVAYFLYLASFFVLLRTYTNLVLAEYDVSYLRYGLCLLKSLVLAKIILTGEMLRLDRKLGDVSLAVLTVYRAAVFSVFVLVFEVLEHLILGAVHGKAPAEVLAELLDQGWPRLLALVMVVFVALLPFFAFKETARALGGNQLKEMFFKRRSQWTRERGGDLIGGGSA
jgi:hypothetical protein